MPVHARLPLGGTNHIHIGVVEMSVARECKSRVCLSPREDTRTKNFELVPVQLFISLIISHTTNRIYFFPAHAFSSRESMCCVHSSPSLYR
jgi:hypothetical protein